MPCDRCFCREWKPRPTLSALLSPSGPFTPVLRQHRLSSAKASPCQRSNDGRWEAVTPCASPQASILFQVIAAGGEGSRKLRKAHLFSPCSAAGCTSTLHNPWMGDSGNLLLASAWIVWRLLQQSSVLHLDCLT